MPDTHFSGNVVGAAGLAVGPAASQVTVASSAGQLYHRGVALVPTAATINNIGAAFGTVAFSAAVKVAKIALAAGVDTGGGIFSWLNPEAASIIIQEVVVDLTVVANAACTISIGTTAVSGTTLSNNLITALDVRTATGTFNNISDPGASGKSRQKLLSGQWVTGSTASGASAGLAGNAYIYYILA